MAPLIATLVTLAAFAVGGTGIVFLFINEERRSMGIKMIIGSVVAIFLIYFISGELFFVFVIFV